jgi:hypothetical protein
MPEDYNGTPLPEDPKPEQGKDKDENIPDWMKEAGWETSSGTFDESKPVFDDLEDEDEIVPADIPAWLEEAAPEGFNFDSEPPAEQHAEEAILVILPIPPSAKRAELRMLLKKNPQLMKASWMSHPGSKILSLMKTPRKPLLPGWKTCLRA